MREPFYLNKAEYAKIVSEINTNYAKYEGKKIAAHLSFGTDNQAYSYMF